MADTKGLQASDAVHVNESVNRHRTTALSAIESKEPALAAPSAANDTKSSRVEHSQRGFMVHLFKMTILPKKKKKEKKKAVQSIKH